MPQAAFPQSFAPKKTIAWRVVGLLLFFFLLLNACGRKAPPVAPGLELPPEIGDLKGDLYGNTLALSWSIAAKSFDAHLKMKGFYLYQAVIPSSQSACSNCPKTFERIARISLFPNKKLPDGKRQWTYQLPLTLGVTYAFKVNIIFTDHLGVDSNILEIKP